MLQRGIQVPERLAHGVPHPVKGQRFLEKRALNLRSDRGEGFGEGVVKAESSLHEGLREEGTARPKGAGRGVGGAKGRQEQTGCWPGRLGQIQKGLGRR